MGILIGLNLVGDNELNISIHKDDEETFSGKKTRPLIADLNISFKNPPQDVNRSNESARLNLESENPITAGSVNTKLEPIEPNLGSVNASLGSVSEDSSADVIDLTDELQRENHTASVRCNNRLDKSNENSSQPKVTTGYYLVEKILGSRLNPTTKKHEFLLSLKDCSSTSNSWSPVTNSENIDLSDPDSVLYVQKSDDQMNAERASTVNSSETDTTMNEEWNCMDVEEPSTLKQEMEEDQLASRDINSASVHEGRKFKEELPPGSPSTNTAFTCSWSGSSFADESLVKKHSRKWNKKVRCTRCPRSFPSQFHLSQHFRVHTKNREFRCTMCGGAYGSGTLLKYHQRQAHRLRYLRNPRLRINGRRNKENTSTRSAVKNSDAVEDDTRVQPGSESHRCHRFNQLFDSKSSPQVHGNGKLSRRGACAVCKKRFFFPWEREVHADMHRKNTDRTPAALAAVESNTSNRRSSESNTCHRCDKNFTFRADALFHQQNAHDSNANDNECFMCGFVFKISKQTKQSLRRHMFVHTGERPLKCELCDHTCVLNGELRKHIRNKHRVK